MTYWLPWIWMFGPPIFALAMTLGFARRDLRVLPLTMAPPLWAVPLFGALAIGLFGHGGKLMFLLAAWMLLAGWAAQLALCAAVGRRTGSRRLPTMVFVFNVPASFMALLGLGQGAAGVSM